jgi:hypothetical protein
VWQIQTATKARGRRRVTYYLGRHRQKVRTVENYEVIVDSVTGIAPPDSDYAKLADSLRDIVSTYDREMQITQAVLNQADADTPKSGYDTDRILY